MSVFTPPSSQEEFTNLEHGNIPVESPSQSEGESLATRLRTSMLSLIPSKPNGNGNGKAVDVETVSAPAVITERKARPLSGDMSELLKRQIEHEARIAVTKR